MGQRLGGPVLPLEGAAEDVLNVVIRRVALGQ